MNLYIYNTEADAPLESELPTPICAEKVTINLRAQSNIVALIMTTIAVGVIVIALGITIFLVAYCTYKRIGTVDCLNIHSTNTVIDELQYNNNACYGLGQSNLVTRETNIHTKVKLHDHDPLNSVTSEQYINEELYWNPAHHEDDIKEQLTKLKVENVPNDSIE